ncbi:MAG: glycosyl transferase, partial [Acidobacteriota bacterium]|nr:glycosyl transferase [Acidobacteriota bacterium]
MIPLLGGALCFMAAWLLTEAWRRNALSRRIVDIPNERSSHSTPTPRGGGIAIVVSFSIFLILFHTLGWIDRNLTLAILGGGLLVASVGFFDDHGHVAPRWRLLAHAAAASWALWQLGGIPPLQAGSFVWNWSWVGNLIGATGIIWFINLTNFMDGIDGLAGAETIFVATSSGLLARIDGMGSPAFSCYLLVAATLGFLVHNWPPARIFMG